jgi:hypothetical protein
MCSQMRAQCRCTVPDGTPFGGTPQRRLRLEHCWLAVISVMRRRVKRSRLLWGCPEVAAACVSQCKQLKTYRSEVQSAITITTAGISAVTVEQGWAS